MLDEVHGAAAAAGLDDDVTVQVDLEVELLDDVKDEGGAPLAQEVRLVDQRPQVVLNYLLPTKATNSYCSGVRSMEIYNTQVAPSHSIGEFAVTYHHQVTFMICAVRLGYMQHALRQCQSLDIWCSLQYASNIELCRGQLY